MSALTKSSVRGCWVLLLVCAVLPMARAEERVELAAAAGRETFGQPDQCGGYATTHILVRLTPELNKGFDPADGRVADGAIDALMKQWGVTGIEAFIPGPLRYPDLAAQFGMDRTYRFKVARGTDTPTMAAHFSGAPGVELAEVDGIGGIARIPNDPMFNQQWDMYNIGGVDGCGRACTVDADVDATDAWDLHTGSSEVVLAIVDTGVYASHPDLIGRVISGWNCHDNNANTDDPNGHGTHVTGIAAATGDNGLYTAGMNWNCRILAVRVVSPEGSGNESQCACGLVYAADHGAHVINMSLQYYTGTQTLRGAVDYAWAARALPVAAAGNNRPVISYPARFPNCMAVGATMCDDTWYPVSNYGPEMDVSTPGGCVFSLWNAPFLTFRNSGTSMAAPHVSGLASLIRSWNWQLSPQQIYDIIVNTAEDRGDPGWDPYFGSGRINARAALVAATPLGDMNCDGRVNNFDIDPFVLALVDVEGYIASHPGCSVARADVNGDGQINNFDVDAFVSALVQAGP